MTGASSGEGADRRAGLARQLAEAKQLSDGPDRVAELERISAHADALGEVRLGFDSRLELIRTYHEHDERWRVVAPLDWCLAACARHPGRFDAAEVRLLRWYHRSAAGLMCGTFRIGLDWTRAALAALAGERAPKRTPDDGAPGAELAALHCRIADHLGDEPAARRWLSHWRNGSDAITDDCPACARTRQAELLADWGEWAEAVRVVGPVLDGILRCPEQPEQALATVMLPYLRLGRPQEAAAAHLAAYPRHRTEHEAFPLLAAHLRFCALTGQYDRGLDILAEQLGRLDRPYDEKSAMEFATAGALLCRLAGAAGLGGRGVPRPAHADRHAATLLVPALEADLLATARDLAGRFDARNGTGHQSGRITGWLSELPGPERVELPRLAETGPGGSTGSRREPLVPLSIESIAAVLDQRRDRYVLDEDGSIRGRWDDALIQFERLGEQGEILHAPVIATRRLTADRLAEAYEFCNAWNHDRLLPKAYVHESGDGHLIIAGEVSTDLEYGVSTAQLAALVHSALTTGAALAAAVTDLP